MFILQLILGKSPLNLLVASYTKEENLRPDVSMLFSLSSGFYDEFLIHEKMLLYIH